MMRRGWFYIPENHNCVVLSNKNKLAFNSLYIDDFTTQIDTLLKDRIVPGGGGGGGGYPDIEYFGGMKILF